MQRVAFLLHIKPGCEAEYKRRHADLWPDLSAEMREAGIHSMSIFLDGRRAFVMLESEDYEAAAARLATGVASLRWEVYMADLLETESGGPYDPYNAWPEPLPLAFDWRAIV